MRCYWWGFLRGKIKSTNEDVLDKILITIKIIKRFENNEIRTKIIIKKLN